MPGLLLKRAKSGALPLGEAMAAALTPAPPSAHAGVLARELSTAAALKRSTLALIQLAVNRYGDGLAREQEVVMILSDAIIATFAAESTALRAAAADGDARAALHADAAAVVVHDAALSALVRTRAVMPALLDGPAADEARRQLDVLLDRPPVQTIEARRRIADAVIERRRYPFP
jgi:hypothetical protein